VSFRQNGVGNTKTCADAILPKGHNKYGGWEAWHVPPGTVRRQEKNLPRIRREEALGQWEKLTLEGGRAAVEDWIQEKRRGRGITS